MSINWLESLPIKLSEVKGLCDSPEKRHPLCENLVGELPDDLKRLFTLCQNTSKEALQCFRAILLSQNEPAREAACNRHNELSAKAETLRSIFWVLVRDKFSLWDKGNLGIRKGFQVVWKEEQDAEESEPIILHFASRLEA
ncbi:MAG: hypothetical protein Q7R53_00205 [bacterium]|nr:hypothetical protein [bacterium]